MHELPEQDLEVRLVDHDHVVQALLAKGPHHAFCD